MTVTINHVVAATDITSPNPAASETPVGGKPKRVFDIGFAVFALIGSVIIFLLVAVIVRLTSPGPLLFRHERVGFRGQSFQCLKFRTMRTDGDAILAAHLAENADARLEYARTRKLRRDPRIIPIVGHLLRKTSLDELPQIINVLRGQMSVVGPRPVTQEEVGFYGESEAGYMSVRPGITGLWQVSGRNLLTFEERVVLDARYISSWSLRQDLAILVRTGVVLLTGKGAY